MNLQHATKQIQKRRHIYRLPDEPMQQFPRCGMGAAFVPGFL
jgi:hypothetical protein